MLNPLNLNIKVLATQAAEHARATGKRMPEAVKAVLARYSLTEAQFSQYKAQILSECGRRGGTKAAQKSRKASKKGAPVQFKLF